jgi:hypothetical protein
MPLILAIEPDRKQAGQLTAMVRGRLHAELVLGDSAEHALAALGQRIPDLVLTSALLSPKDESALGERLRALDGAAAHVQTLTIPVLASPSRSAVSRAGGMLSALRRDKSRSSAPEGCDPAVFAEQCKEYLERAAADREALSEQVAVAPPPAKEPARPPVVQSPVTGSEWTVVREEPPVEPSPTVETKSDYADFYEPDAGRTEAAYEDSSTFVEPTRSYSTKTDPKEFVYAAPAHSEFIRTDAPVDDPIESPPVLEDSRETELVRPEPKPARKGRGDRASRRFLDLKHESEGPASLLAAVAALEAEQQVIVVDSSAEEQPPAAEALADNEPADAAHVDISALLHSPAAQASVSNVPVQDDSIEVYEIDASLTASPLDLSAISFDLLSEPAPAKTEQPLGAKSETRSWPILDGLVDTSKGADPAAAGSKNDSASTQPEPATSQFDDLKKWDDIIEALRRDAEQIEVPRASVVNSVETEAENSEPADASTISPESSKADAAGGRKKKKRGKGSPAQDEWGFFDPEQCGFAALIEKLEEITDKDHKPKPRRA